jgi:hypothetical protein
MRDFVLLADRLLQAAGTERTPTENRDVPRVYLVLSKDAAASVKANGYCGTSPIRGDCPAVLPDLGDHAVKSDIRPVEDYENIAYFDGRVTQLKANHRGKPVVLLHNLKS